AVRRRHAAGDPRRAPPGRVDPRARPASLGRVPAAGLLLRAPPFACDVEVVRDPDAIEALDPRQELVQHRDARMASDAKGMHDEQEAAVDAVRALDLRLPDLEHL